VEKLGKLDKVDGFKVEICRHFIKYLSENQMEQQALAKKLKLNPALMSKIVRFQFQEFTIDRLLRLLGPIRPDLIPILKKSSKAIKQKRKNP
jgi:hypothetical protein